MAKIEDAINHGKASINRGDIYMWGGNGERVLDLLPNIVNTEEKDSKGNVKTDNIRRVLTTFVKKVRVGADILNMRGYDCSGLWVDFLNKNGIINGDLTAEGLYNKINNPIKIADISAGDYVFVKGSTKRNHVGLYIGEGKVIEAKGRDYGVVMSDFKDGKWNDAARPKWWTDSKQEETKPVINRKLMYVDGSMMRGDDVKLVQEKLKSEGFELGSIDGIYGHKTEQAVIDFQVKNKLKKVQYGVVDSKTAKALGFEWKG